MKYFYIEPEVSGSLGDGTVIDSSLHPPVIHKLHFEMHGWLGDALMESFPVFIITISGREALAKNDLTGITFSNLNVSLTDEFLNSNPNHGIPKLFWLKPTGVAKKDDFGVGKDGRLIVSEPAPKILEGLGINHAVIEPMDAF